MEAGVRGDGIDGFSALVASVKGVKRGREGIRNYVCKRVCVRARVDAAGRGAACLARGNAVKNGREGIRNGVSVCARAYLAWWPIMIADVAGLIVFYYVWRRCMEKISTRHCRF